MKFEGSKLVRVDYVKLDFANNNKLSLIERTIRGEIDRMTNKKTGWLRCNSHTKENHYLYKNAPGRRVVRKRKNKTTNEDEDYESEEGGGQK